MEDLLSFVSSTCRIHDLTLLTAVYAGLLGNNTHTTLRLTKCGLEPLSLDMTIIHELVDALYDWLDMTNSINGEEKRPG